MILKKPFKFLIKYYRLVHLVLLVLATLILINTKVILDFLNTYINNDYKITVVENMASSYINILLYFYLAIVIIIIIFLVSLFKSKKKKNNLYIFALVYYCILLLASIIMYYLINSLEEGLWIAKDAISFRDIFMVIYYPQYIMFLVYIVKVLGFNIKTFSFEDELKDIRIEEGDNEEVELFLNVETYKAKRYMRKSLREFKYYFLENKIIFIAIISILSIVSIYYIYNNYEKYNYKYKQNEEFVYNGINYTIMDSIITNLNYKGETMDGQYYYLLLKIKITNNNDKDSEVDLSNFLIETGKEKYQVIYDVGHNFIDYGEPYIGNKLEAKKTRIYVISYQIPKEIISNSFQLKIYKDYSTKKESFKAKTIYVKLNPILINSLSQVANYVINDKVIFNATYLNNTYLRIKDYSIVTKYNYTYEECFFGDCRNLQSEILGSYENNLLILDYDFSIDKEVPYYNSNKSINRFANNFMKIRFFRDDVIYTEKIMEVTPKTLKNKLVLKTNSRIIDSSKIDLVINIRNKSYVINIKG